MKQRIFIESEKVRIVTLYEKDITQRYVDFLNDKEVTKFLGIKNKVTLKSQRKYVKEKTEDKNCLLLGIYINGTKKFIGTIKLEPINWDYKDSKVSIMIGDGNYWRKGYGTECIRQTKYLAFNILKLKNLYLYVKKKNIGAIKVYEKNGFKKTGYLMEIGSSKKWNK